MSRSIVVLLAWLVILTGCALDTPRETVVRMIFSGDLMFDDGVGRAVAAGADPLAPFDAVLRAADFRIGNLESPIATSGQPRSRIKNFTFRAHPRVLQILKGRFDAVSVANNHSLDYGHEAFLETLQRLSDADIGFFGGGRNLREAHAPLWVERRGLRIAILGYNDFKPRSFEAGPTWPGVAWCDELDIVADIRAARRAGADIVIPFLHWGWEMEPEPTARQQTLARLMIDAGATAVIGAHPHVTQGAAVYREQLIVWSLGNFVFEDFDDPRARVGWLLRLAVDRDGVVAWDTVEARIDDNGTPHPVRGASTPCGRRGVPQVLTCHAADGGTTR
jgi:poly-gamma-glutamate synthesis protein (capsule biosynthesis protein)